MNSHEAFNHWKIELKMYGVIFDSEHKKTELEQLEKKIASPSFWENQNESQQVLQKRKTLEQTLSIDDRLTKSIGDIDGAHHFFFE